MGPRQCEVCKNAQSKYKCPSCLAPYCSLVCFKKHKGLYCCALIQLGFAKGKRKGVAWWQASFQFTLCKKGKKIALVNHGFDIDMYHPPLHCYDEIPCVKAVSAKPETCPIRLPDKSYQVDEPSLVLQKKQLESLAFSSEIREALKDVELQKSICKIDSSTGAENELDRAMEHELFRKFTEKVLSIISP